MHSSEDKNINILFSLYLDEKLISLPYTDIYVTHSHLVNFCQLYEKIASRMKNMEQKQSQEKLLIQIEEQEKEIQSLKKQLKNALTETNQVISDNGIKDLTPFFSKDRKEYPNHFLETIFAIYNEVWVDFFMNRKDEAEPRPTKEMVSARIKAKAPDNGWSENEIEMLEKIACPILREGGKIKKKQETHNGKVKK